MLDVVLDRDRQDPVVDERAYCLLEQPLLGGKLEIHRPSLDSQRWALPARVACPRAGPGPLTAAAFNWSWVAQHTITSKLPRLTLRHPVAVARAALRPQALALRLPDRARAAGRSTSSPSASPRSRSFRRSRPAVSALLAVLAQREEGAPLPRREWVGVGLAVVGPRLPLGFARRRLEWQQRRAPGSPSTALVPRLVRRRRRRDRARRPAARPGRRLRARRRGHVRRRRRRDEGGRPRR